MAEVDIVNIDLSNSSKSVGELRQELKDLQDQLAEGKITNEEFVESASNIQSVLDEVQDAMQAAQTKAKGLEGTFKGVTSIMAGVAGGTNAVIGTFQALGVVNEDTSKKLNNTITALMGVVQGLGKLPGAAKSFNVLTKAVGGATKGVDKLKMSLISSGIGAIIVALGAAIALVVTHFEDFKDGLGDALEGAGPVKDVLSDLGKYAEIAAGVFVNVLGQVIGDIIRNVVTLGKAIGKVFKGDWKGAGQEIKDNFVAPWETAKKVAKSLPEVIDKVTDKVNNPPKEKTVVGKIKDEVDELAKATEEATKSIEDLIKGIDKTPKDPLQEILDEIDELAKKGNLSAEQIQEYKDQATQAWEDEQKRLDKLQEEADELAKKKAEAARFEKSIADLFKDPLKEKENAILQKITDLNTALSVGRISIDEYNTKLAELNGQLSDVQMQMAGFTKVNDLFAGQIQVNAEEYSKFTAGLAKTADIASQVGGAMSNLFNSLADNFEEGSKQQEAMNIATVIMQTATGAITAFAQAMQLGPIAGPIVGAIQTAAVIASGVAQLKNIKNKKMPSKSEASNSAKSTTSVAKAATPNVSRSIDFNENQGQYMQDTRVYVVESDIRQTGQRVQVIENDNKF